MKKNLLFFALILCVGYLETGTASASTLIAQWRNFDGLTSNNDLRPIAGLALQENTWTFKLNNGSVENGILSTGTGKAPIIAFNGKAYQMGGYDLGGYTLALKVYPAEDFLANKPLWQLGNKIGILLSDSNAFRGIWNSSLWNDNQFKSLPFEWSPAPKPTTMVFVAPYPADNSFGFHIYVNGNRLSPDPKGLKSNRFNAQQFSFGNYINQTTGGISYKIESISVYNGPVSNEDIQKIPLGTLTWQGTSGSEWTASSSWKELEENDSYIPDKDLLFLPQGENVCTAQISSAVSAGNCYLTGGNYHFSGEGPLTLSSLTLSKQAKLTLGTPATLHQNIVLQDNSALSVLEPVQANKVIVRENCQISVNLQESSFTCTQAPEFRQGTIIQCSGTENLGNGFYPIISWTSGELTANPILQLDSDIQADLLVVDNQLGLSITPKYIWNGSQGATWNSALAWLYNDEATSYPEAGGPVLLNGSGIRQIDVPVPIQVQQLTVKKGAGAYSLSGSGNLSLSQGNLIVNDQSELSLNLPFEIDQTKITPEGTLHSSARGTIQSITGNGIFDVLTGGDVTIQNWGSDMANTLSIQEGAKVSILANSGETFKPGLSGKGRLKLSSDQKIFFTMRNAPFQGTLELSNTKAGCWIVFGIRDEIGHTPFAGRPSLINNCPASGNPAIIFGLPTVDHPIQISNLSGSGHFRADWDAPTTGSTDVRTLDAQLTQNCEFSGTFEDNSTRKLRLVVGASVPGATLTLSGNNTTDGNLEVKDSAKVLLPESGCWSGPISVASDATLSVSRLTQAMKQKNLTLNGTLELIAKDGALPVLNVHTLTVGPTASVKLQGKPTTSPVTVLTCDTLPETLPQPPERYHWKEDLTNKSLSLVYEKGSIIFIE